MRLAYLNATHASGFATPETGWTPKFFLLAHQDELAAGRVLRCSCKSTSKPFQA